MSKIRCHQYEDEPDQFEIVGGMPRGVLVARKDDILVIKIAGYTYWGGIGFGREYQHAEYQVYRVIWESPSPPNILEIEVEFLISYPVRQSK